MISTSSALGWGKVCCWGRIEERPSKANHVEDFRLQKPAISLGLSFFIWKAEEIMLTSWGHSDA